MSRIEETGVQSQSLTNAASQTKPALEIEESSMKPLYSAVAVSW